MSTPKSFDDMSQSKYLKPANLPDQPVTVVIEKFEQIEVGDPKEKKWFVFFKGKDKCLGLNATRREALKVLYGTPGDAIGKAVDLRKGKTFYAGKQVDCIEVHPPSDEVPYDGPTEGEDQEIPF